MSANEIPERIWAAPSSLKGWDVGFCTDKKPDDDAQIVEYIRADRCAPQPTCRKCGGTMQPGHALAQTCTSGAPDDLGGDAQTMSAGGPGLLIDCRKCEDCGWSVSADQQDAQPVMWRARHSETEEWQHFNRRPSWLEVQPLYAHPPQPSETVVDAGEDLVRAMRLFWEADEAADECRAAGKDLEAARYDKMATGRWQSIPEKIDALDAALRALKGGEANG